jgi:uncharacterized membrane protein YdcZ (DUF606 family)
MFMQVISLLGAGLLLGAYLANLRGWLGREDRMYSALNLVGALLLAWVAVVDQRWGFILLEFTWALVSLPPLLRPRRP